EPSPAERGSDIAPPRYNIRPRRCTPIQTLWDYLYFPAEGSGQGAEVLVRLRGHVSRSLIFLKFLEDPLDPPDQPAQLLCAISALPRRAAFHRPHFSRAASRRRSAFSTVSRTRSQASVCRSLREISSSRVSPRAFSSERKCSARSSHRRARRPTNEKGERAS